jgi:hypothetical protein
MTEIIPSTHATKTTIVTMVRLFFGAHPKIANVTMVLTKPDVTIHTMIGFAALSGVTITTNDFTNRESIDRMVIVFRLRRAHQPHHQIGRNGETTR